MVVVAIGTRSNPLLTATAPDLEVNEYGYIETDEYGMTSMPGVFAGGDIVRGAATVILAMGDGKRAAAAIDRWLTTGSAAEARAEAAPAGRVATAAERRRPAGPTLPRRHVAGRTPRRRAVGRLAAAATCGLSRAGGPPRSASPARSSPQSFVRSRQTAWMWFAPFWVLSYSMRNRGPRTA